MKIVISFLKRIGFLAVAAIVTVVIASVLSTNRVINNLNTIGASSELSDRFTMSVYDLAHFGTLYVVFIFLAFLIAFLAASGVFKIAGFGRTLIYVVAGITAMFVMLWAMEQVFFGVPIVAGARDSLGLLLQMLAGGIGGFIFAKLTSARIIQSR